LKKLQKIVYTTDTLSIIGKGTVIPYLIDKLEDDEPDPFT
jgi:hypothetical protein